MIPARGQQRGLKRFWTPELVVRYGDEPHVRAHLTEVIDERIGDIAAKLVQEKALNPHLLSMSDVERIRRDQMDVWDRGADPW